MCPVMIFTKLYTPGSLFSTHVPQNRTCALQVEEYSDEVFDLLNNGAHIFFCGLKGMMPGIQVMLERVATEKG